MTCLFTGIASSKKGEKIECLSGQNRMLNTSRSCLFTLFSSLQSEILEKAGPNALNLGLLMGTEDDPREEEQKEVLSFHHLLIMEFLAGKYISTLSEVSTEHASFW